MLPQFGQVFVSPPSSVSAGDSVSSAAGAAGAAFGGPAGFAGAAFPGGLEGAFFGAGAAGSSFFLRFTTRKNRRPAMIAMMTMASPIHGSTSPIPPAGAATFTFTLVSEIGRAHV